MTEADKDRYLTKDQRRDVETLRVAGRLTRYDAIAEVTRAKRRIAAPTMEMLDAMQAKHVSDRMEAHK